MAPTNHKQNTGAEHVLIPHLFRTEYSRIVAVLCKHYGLQQLSAAEDVASETFMAAVENWAYKGIPEQPVAWLYKVAKNKARNLLQRTAIHQKAINNLNEDNTLPALDDIDLSAGTVADSQLQMMFALCHPSIPPQAQVAIALRVLCGFGIDEIAVAFLTNKEVVNKRIYRAKEKLRNEKIELVLPSEPGMQQRLDTVLATISLLFSEGYYSETDDEVIRKDLCQEAMRLCYILLQNPATNLPHANALMALMCFQASRFKARQAGGYVLYHNQDESLWDGELIARGIYYLHCASTGSQLTVWHYQACIASWYTQKADTPGKWQSILKLYNGLLALQDNPIARLNRVYATWRVHGATTAINEMNDPSLPRNQYYYILLGQLNHPDKIKTMECYEQALQLTHSKTEKEHMLRLIAAL